MDATIEARLRDAGIETDSTISTSATIRPETLDASAADTLAAPASTAPRSLPRLSVDLRGSLAGEPATPPRAGADLEVTGVIGEGGMGRVLLARQHSLARDVAVKTAKDGASDAARLALLAEGVITGQLEHPAIVPVHALGVDEAGRPAMVMKRIEGVAWRDLARDWSHEGWDGWPGDPDDRLPGHLTIFMQICNAVHFANARGIVHRDIKLENVLIGRFGDVYLADWGVAAKAGTREAQLCGTPGYMAPEMAAGGAVDARTDVYLLGATLHEILTGSLRHPADTVAQAIVAAYLSEPHDYPDDVPADLAALLNRACHKDPDERPQDAKAMRDEVARFLDHRAMAALARDAASRLDRIEELLAYETLALAERAELDRLAAEASFAFERAFERWPGDEPARAARRRLDGMLEERRRHAAELERAAHERDPRVSAKMRAVGLAAIAAVSASVSAVALSLEHEPTPAEAIAYPSVTWLVLLAGTIVFRRAMLRNTFNRQVVVLVHALLLVLLAGRVLGLFVEIPLATHFARDSFMLAAAFGVASVAYLPWIRWVAFQYFICFVVCTLWPDYALVAFGITTATSSALAAAIQWAAR